METLTNILSNDKYPDEFKQHTTALIDRIKTSNESTITYTFHSTIPLLADGTKIPPMLGRINELVRLWAIPVIGEPNVTVDITGPIALIHTYVLDIKDITTNDKDLQSVQ